MPRTLGIACQLCDFPLDRTENLASDALATTDSVSGLRALVNPHGVRKLSHPARQPFRQPTLPLIRLPTYLASRRDINRWNARSPVQKLAGAHYSRAKRLNGGRPNGYWSTRQWLDLVEACGSTCYWCGEFTNKPSPDHLVPLAKGGRNSIANLVVSCRRCQPRRQDKSAEEFVAYLAAHPDADQEAAWRNLLAVIGKPQASAWVGQK